MTQCVVKKKKERERTNSKCRPSLTRHIVVQYTGTQEASQPEKLLSLCGVIEKFQALGLGEQIESSAVDDLSLISLSFFSWKMEIILIMMPLLPTSVCLMGPNGF